MSRRPLLWGLLATSIGLQQVHAELHCATAHLPPEPASKSASSRTPRRLITPEGSVAALVLFSKFAGEAPADVTPPPESASLFDVGRQGSLSHFYHTMSGGRLALEGEVATARYEAPHGASSYVSPVPGEPGQYGRFVRDVLVSADAEIDFSRFDNDGADGVPNSGDDDGWVDYLFVVVRSTPRDFILGAATGVASLGMADAFVTDDLGPLGEPILIDGRRDAGSVVGEGTFSQIVGTMAHEFGHALRLPDLYDTSYGNDEEDSAGIGRWGLMAWGAHGWNGDDGPNELSAWSLERLGWISEEDGRLVHVGADAHTRVADLLHGGAIHRLPLPTKTFGDIFFSSEYLLLEYRSRDRYYGRGMPADGLLVWHVRPHVASNGDESHKLVDLICADGLYHDAGFPIGLHAGGRTGADNLDFWSHDAAYRGTHGGNQGDATDPFDGLRFHELAAVTNPSTDPKGELAAAVEAPRLRLRRQDDAMSVDVTLGRWAGAIETPVNWSGTVFVDGDVTVTPSGRLTIHDGTQVLLAGRDRTASGVDRSKTEIVIQGDLVIRAASLHPEGTLFRAAHAGQTWSGIRLQPGADSWIDVRPDSYEILDADRGVYFPAAPAGADGLESALVFDDSNSLSTAGNDDGQLSPGETFRLSVELTNWTLTPMQGVQATASWPSPLLSANGTRISSYITSLDLTPGVPQQLDLPALTVQPDAAAGDTLEFVVRLQPRRGNDGQRVLQLPVAVVGEYPEHSLALTVPQARRTGSLRVISRAGPTRVEAQTRGSVETVDLLVRSTLTDSLLEVVPMARGHDAMDGSRRFTVDWQAPRTDALRLQARITDGRGHSTFSDAHLDLWTTANPDGPPALVFFDRLYPSWQRDRIRRLLVQQLEAAGRAVRILTYDPTQVDPYFDGLIGETGPDGLLIWLGRNMPADTQEAFRRFLDEGGKALIVSDLVGSRPPEFRRQVLHIGATRRIADSRSAADELLGLGSFSGVAFQAPHYALEILPPAIPLMIDAAGRPAGLAVLTERHDLVVLGFFLVDLEPDLIDRILTGALSTLQGTSELPVSIGKAGVGAEALVVLPRTRVSRIDIEAGAPVARVELHLVSQSAAAVQISASRDDQSDTYNAEVSPEDLAAVRTGRVTLNAVTFDSLGRPLPQVALRDAVVLDPDSDLLLLADASYPDGLYLAARLVAAIEGVGIRPSLVWPVQAGSRLRQQLLDLALTRDVTVAWLALRMPSDVSESLEAFVADGGRLMVASSTFSGLPIVETVGRIAHLDFTSTRSASPLAFLHGGDTTLRVQHSRIGLRPPAVPLLVDQDGHAAMGMARYGRGVVAAGVFDLAATRPEDAADAIRGILDRMRSSPGVELSVGPTQSLDTLVTPRDSLRVQARFDDEVEAAELVVLRRDELSVRQSIPMLGNGTDFVAPYSAPAFGEYLLTVRARRDADWQVGGRTAGLSALLPEKDSDLLVFLPETLERTARQHLGAQIDSLLEPLGMHVAILPQAPRESDLYRRWLPPFSGAAGVLWMGSGLSLEAQRDFRDYVAGGGNLVIASVGLPLSPRGSQLVGDLFGAHLGHVAEGRIDFGHAASAVRSWSLIPQADTQVLLRTDSGAPVAVARRSGGFGSAYYGFDLMSLPAAARLGVLGDMLSRLTDGDVSQAVRVVAIEAPLPVVMAGTLRPRVRLRGATTSTAASLVAYEIAQGTRIVHRGQVEIGALTASQDSVLEIPVVGDLPAGAYILRAGVLQGDRPTGVQEIRFHIVQPREPFEAVALPGPLVGGNGAGFLDVDDDGRLDLYLTRLGDANLFFHNTADGFAERADEIGLDDRQRGRSFAAADIDADGDLDVYLVNEAANALMRNDGGAFAPVAADEALRDPSPGRGAAFFDADDDGLLDLYVINAWAPNRLFVRGAEGWREASAELGLDDGANARGLALADTDADGDVDLFLANNDGSSRLLADRGESFVDVTTATGLAGVAGDVACAFADYDGDGHTDLLVANQGGPTRLYRGRISGFAPVDSVDLGGRNVGVAFFDFDNDGDLDLATTALDPVFGGDELYENLDGELLPVGGLMSLSRSAAGRGISVGDYDDDGDQDLFVADNLASRLYTNRSRMARALRVELVGPPDNREGIGARVRVALGERILVRDMQPSYGYGSYRPAVLHFGLGTLAFTNVHVLWPDGARSLVDSAVESVPESGRLVVHHPEVPTVVDLVVDPRPATFYLDAAFPNPFNARVVLPFGVDASTRVRLQVYGVGGQRIRTLVDEDLATGGYRATWDGRDGDGRPVASGVYLVRLQSTTRQATVRVLLLK